MRPDATWHTLAGVTTLYSPMSNRIQQIIAHERAIYRSLTPFGFALVLIVGSLVVLVLRSQA